MCSTATPEIPMALGTAQLGMAYGVANSTGQPDFDTSVEIVRVCWENGVRYFDTAQAYGDSEAVLGKSLAALRLEGQARVISKLNPGIGIEAMMISVEDSIRRLGVERLWALLLHSESQMDRWDESFGRTFRDLKRQGLTERLGVSFYSPRRALQSLDLPDIDVVQVPANVFDRRMKRAGFFQRAEELGKTVFVRSVYLQGLALMESASAPGFARTAVNAFESFCSKRALDRREFAVDYVRQMANAAFLVIGAELPGQAQQDCLLAQHPVTGHASFAAWDRLWPDDQMPLVDPSQWPRN